MAQRVFTVGSLIPGKIVPVPNRNIQQSPAIKLERKVPEQHSPVIKPEKIIVQQGDIQFEISPEKGKLLDAALNQGKQIQFKCRKGTCGQCTVKVLQGSGLSEPNEQEHNKLNKAIAGSYRLACQAEIL
ncbi:2Fe-2S iron-sulfur cluster-binding protein [Neobacillus sp. 19]|uniref:2Fe-2S iron-sulfur cluster-binding protein n=1 Tax=Neobacillus sp. 19 TaxID=3394458 RepID=UPI003BF64D8D